MGRTLDMEKTSRRVGQVHKSQKNNIENMNKSTKSITVLKNELYVNTYQLIYKIQILKHFSYPFYIKEVSRFYFKLKFLYKMQELYFQLENRKYELESSSLQLNHLKSYLNEHNSNIKSFLNQEVTTKMYEAILQKGEMLVDIQDRTRGIKPYNSEIYNQIQSLRETITTVFRNKNYLVFDNSYNNFQRCQFPFNMLFQNDYKFIEINQEEKEYICLNSSIPGILEVIQSRINIKEKFKIVLFTPIINEQFNQLADIKVEVISEHDSQSIEQELIQMTNDFLDMFKQTINFNCFKQNKYL